MGCKYLFLLGMVALIGSVWLPVEVRVFAAETTAERLARLEKMSAAEKDSLRRSLERLEKLDPEQRHLLRQLDQEISADPQGDQLRTTMLRYHEWLRELSISERTELLSAPESQRVDKIKKMLDVQRDRKLKDLAMESLSREDMDRVRSWVGDILRRELPRLMAELPPETQARLREFGPNREMRSPFWEVVTRMSPGRRPGERFPQIGADKLHELLRITEQDRKVLVARLSPEAQKVYGKLELEKDRQEVCFRWIWSSHVLFQRTPPSDQELKRIRDSLDSKERDRLADLPPEELRREMMEHYFKQQRWWSGPPEPGRESGRGRPGGPRGGEFRGGFPKDGNRPPPPPNGQFPVP